ncbi:branched-chain amino acid ABC transporter permease [Thermodesulforhabdus norvegica]|uniref:Amino acid/amide ABC transporter membrane protein 2, HAAT family (TC 3.A.1.4.-) n=1 Tax=Thermodesulforhabdus norvegica TaxID=39841 RepID=A0A1I4UC60_9BACT|nr:branched-chain amino acid ABC transporter permease [Thermodesulforhabdus norvegica]SFM86313.1 amino acid/amide ABC transporter membrane protein 2, HAAT family (TC 3.A.1.4.-) [Thermodesulforhabdus norvegica]
MTKKTRNLILNCVSILIIYTVLWFFQKYGTEYQIRILNNIAVFITLAVSYNLVNGICGLLHLGPNAFITIGAYTSALLTMSPAEKQLSFIIEPLIWPLNSIQVPFVVSLVAAGLVTTFFAFLISFPVLRVRGDYLAIVTLGFGEVVRVLCNALQNVTNGPLGLKGLTPYTNVWWSWSIAIITIIAVQRLINSSWGLAMKAIREDEIAAKAMGIDPFRHLMLAFLVSAFFSGVAGGLLAHLITTISPTLFTFFLTFNLLIIIVVGGLGSTTGAVIGATLFAWGGEALRVVESPIDIGPVHIPGIPGMRMVIFSIILMLVIIFARRGITGRNEFSWDWLIEKLFRSQRA